MKKRTITSSFALSLLFPGLMLLAILVTTLTFGFLYSGSGNMLYFWLLLGLDIAFLVGFAFLLWTSVRYVHKVYYDGFYIVSKSNMTKLAMGQSDFQLYPDDHIYEMDDLNDCVAMVSERWNVSVLYSRDVDYHQLGLTLLDEATHLVEEKTLWKHLPNLIHASGAFTSGILDLNYEIGKEKLTIEEKKRLLEKANEAFSFLPGRLFAYGDDEKSLLCYLPGLDSMRIVTEKIQGFTADLSVSKRVATGAKFFPVKAAMVCYPHSAIADLESDLRYAMRQDAPITIFLPDRKKVASKSLQVAQHQNTVAFFNKILLPIRELKGENLEEDKATLKTVFQAVASYIGANVSQLVLLEDTTRTYYSFFAEGKEADQPVDADYVERSVSIVDEDHSFYFSSRASCSEVIARDVDNLGIRAGFIYAISNAEKLRGAIFLGKTDGDLVMDSYAKEALIRMGEAFTDYFFLEEKERRAKEFQRQSEHILGISNYAVYKIDDSTFNLTYISPNIRALFPGAELGEKCHKSFYGSDRVCPHCPIREYSKMHGNVQAKLSGKVRGIEIETSLTLNDTKSHERSLLIERISGTPATDPYDRNWLTYSFATLVAQLENAYLVHSRGYVLLICLDNIDSFIGMEGSEGACFTVRCLIQEIKKALNTHDVYAYNPAAIAVLLPRVGHVEMIDVCEKIYDISKKHFLDNGQDDSFRLTYLPLGYPRGYTSATDFFAHAEEFYRNGGYKHGEDFIYFHDHSISRSASKRTHMLAVIDEVFGTRTASCVYLQPMVQATDKKIFGAEILLRVEDTQRHNFFRADELSRIAEENGRISLITESLLNFVNGLYQEYGSSVFAINNFRRIAINVDAAFLRDSELNKKVQTLYQERHLGKDFLSFEVPEDLIGEDFGDAGNAFASSGAVLVCDRYTGKYVSLEKLKQYGFREIKMPRELVNGIEVDAKKLAQIADIIANAKALGLKASVVGVENEAQYLALRNLDETMLLQGYHFYKPLSRADLITAVVHN